jgi:NAD+ synthase
MSTLFAVSQTMNGRGANTCNLSEVWVGYTTIFGDAAGQFSPLGKMTVTEVKGVARELGLPEKFIEKVPRDGLCEQTDEEKLGFTYDVLDEYIRTGVCEDPITKDKIDKMHKANKFKMEPMPTFNLWIL